MLNENQIRGKQVFYVSDFTDSFEQSAQYFFGQQINLKKTTLI